MIDEADDMTKDIMRERNVMYVSLEYTAYGAYFVRHLVENK